MRKSVYPSVKDLKKMVSDASILNCPLTMKDIERAEKIYSKDIASLKGKTVSRKAIKVELSGISEDVKN
jgi:hypothetical protein